MMSPEFARGNICFYNFNNLEEPILKQILDWRNNARIRIMMNNTETIALQNHLDFVKKLKDNKHSTYWLVSRKNKSCGVVYLHSNTDEPCLAEWGYYLAPNFLGTGIGFEVGFEAIHIFFKNLGITTLTGFVKQTNFENKRIQEALGFKEDSSTENLISFKLRADSYKVLPQDFLTFQKIVFYGRTTL